MIDQFSNPFHCQNREKICNNTITKDYLKCVATLPVKCQCPKATVENKTSVTTHFKKLPTGNNVSIVSVICLKQLSHPAVVTSDVQCVLLAAGRRTLKIRYYRNRLVFSCCFEDTDISQGSVATHDGAMGSLVIILLRILS